MERNLPQGSRQWCGHQKFKVLGYRNPSTAISQFRRAAACPKRGHKAALPHKIWLAFFSSMQTLRLVLLERCTVSWVRLIFRSPPASTQGIKSLLYLSQFWRHICCQPPEARDWPKTPEKKGCNLHIPSYHCCSNVYVFIYKTNIHGQVILDFSREKNDMKSSPTSQRVQAGTWATITEMSMQLTSFPNVVAVLPYRQRCVSSFVLSSDADSKEWVHPQNSGSTEMHLTGAMEAVK